MEWLEALPFDIIPRMGEQYLFFDMDGTLIEPSTHHLLPSTIQAVRQAMHQGCHVFLCTGRGYKMALEYQAELEIPGVIFSNGAGIAYQGKILETTSIASNIVRKMTDLVSLLQGGYQILGINAIYQNEKEHQRFAKRFPQQYPNLSEEEVFHRKAMKLIDEYSGEAIQKIDFNFDSELTADLFFARIPASLEVVLSGGYYANLGRRGGELMQRGTTKGRAVKRVLSMFGASAHDAYGFGDSMNDITMLQDCGTGIAMGNSTEELKKCADYVTNDASHDGIYNAMKHFQII
jgi:Cof subfamily protein (haloacid dehalogenase superfamily)